MSDEASESCSPRGWAYADTSVESDADWESEWTASDFGPDGPHGDYAADRSD